MLASLSAQWVLLMNPKTGTTSLNKAFRRHSEVYVGGDPKLKHLTYIEYRKMFGNFFVRKGCEVFVVVRNPIDVLRSWYRYRARPELAEGTHKRSRNYTGNITFEEFLRAWSNGEQPHSRVGMGIDFCLGKDGALGPELIIYRYEDLNHLFDRVAKKSGLKIKVPTLNKSPEGVSTGDVDDETIANLPRVAEALKLYSEIPFVTVPADR